MSRWQAATLSLVLSFSACATKKAFVSEHFARPIRVAVLPMVNETNDLDGPVNVRKALFEMLAQRGYSVIPLAEVDAKLDDHGFTDGGQLAAATPQKIGEWIGAEGLFYSNLQEFNYILLGYYTQRAVSIKARMVDAKTGETLWEADRGWTTRLVATEKKKAEQQLAAQLAIKFAEKLTHIPLQFETTQAVLRLLNTLP